MYKQSHFNNHAPVQKNWLQMKGFQSRRKTTSWRRGTLGIPKDKFCMRVNFTLILTYSWSQFDDVITKDYSTYDHW